jgi:hypothetical protein
MRLAFIVSGYKRPDLLTRLVRALDGRPCAIHIDAKSQIFSEVVEALKGIPNVHFLPRHNCHWGMFGHVEASLEGLRWFRGTDCDYALLLTGQCYPLRTISSIESCLSALNGMSIIDYHSFPYSRWEKGGWSRVDRFHVHAFGRRWRIRPWRRQLPSGHHAYGGGSYWCLSRASAEYVLDFIDKHPNYIQFFRRVLIPDEIFFQTILVNSPLRDTLINDTIHHIEWTLHQPSPAILTSADSAFASGKWFARKFEDQSVLDIIDERRAENSYLRPSIAPGVLSAEELRQRDMASLALYYDYRQSA